MARRRQRARLRGWMPNRVAARFISGGKHQTFRSIAKAPLRTRTVTTGKTRRTQYQAHKKKLARQAQAERRAAARKAAAQRKANAQYAASVKKAAAKPARKPRPKSPPIAVNPRTGKPITWAQAQKALREAQERAERLAAGLPGDAPAKTGRPRVAKKTAAARPAARPATPRHPSTPRRPAKPRATPTVPAPVVPGKTLTGVYWAMTCECQGTGRIVQYKTDGTPNGSISCPTHGRKARGERKFTARRAVKHTGLPGLSSWLEGKRRKGRGNLDRKQERAHDRATTKRRHAGPTVECGACDAGIVNRELADRLRGEYIARIEADREAAGRSPLGARRLAAMARKAYPYDHCRACAGLGRVSKSKAGDWYERADLKDRHRPTPREKAAGRVDPALLPRSPRRRRTG